MFRWHYRIALYEACKDYTEMCTVNPIKSSLRIKGVLRALRCSVCEGIGRVHNEVAME